MSDGAVGWIMGGVGLVGVLAMVVNGGRSDRTGERALHALISMLLVALGFIVVAGTTGSPLIIVGLAMIACGINAFLPAFWCLPLERLSGTAAAGGIAVINWIGNLGGFVAPALLGSGKAATGSTTGGLLILGALALGSAVLLLPFRRR